MLLQIPFLVYCFYIASDGGFEQQSWELSATDGSSLGITYNYTVYKVGSRLQYFMRELHADRIYCVNNFQCRHLHITPLMPLMWDMCVEPSLAVQHSIQDITPSWHPETIYVPFASVCFACSLQLMPKKKCGLCSSVTCGPWSSSSHWARS